jgi:hypothetical protein
VIVAADGLTALDAVSCQLNLEHTHDRQPAWKLVSATDGQVQAANPRASRQPVFDFHARRTSAGHRSRQSRPAPATGRTGR